MDTHRSPRYARGGAFRSSFKPPPASVIFSVESRSATDDNLRGGDLFDIFTRHDGSATVLLADVSSKGPLGTVHTEMVRRAFRSASITERSPACIMATLNELQFTGPPPLSNTTFATAVIAAIEPSTSVCRYASAGHDIGFLIRGRKHRHLAPTGPLLGVMPEAIYTDCIEAFGIGDLLLLATDGFTECRHAESSQQFGTTGIARALARADEISCRSVSKAITQSVDIFTAGRYLDDATLALVARNDP